MITITKARVPGLNTILVTSGKESVQNSFNEIVNSELIKTSSKLSTKKYIDSKNYRLLRYAIYLF